MKRRVFPLFSFLFLIFISLLFSCNLTYDELLKEYNSNFTYNPPSSENPKIGDADFDESDMIYGAWYAVSVNNSFSIIAPEASKSCGQTEYSWVLTRSKNNKQVLGPVKGREFEVEFNSSTFQTGVSYTLTLTVTTESNKFSDSAQIYLFSE